MPALTRDEVERWLQKPAKAFHDQDLTGCDLSDLELGGCDFKREKFHGAKLAGATLEACDFRQAVFDGADLTGATFIGSLFQEARLDGAIIKDATFETCDFEGATWNGAVVKRCTFESCDDIEGLAPHKIYASLSDMPEDEQKLAVCRERFSPLQALVGGTIEGTAEDTACQLVGEFRGRKFSLHVDFYDGSPTLHLDTRETEDVWFYVYRDPKRRAKAEAARTDGDQEPQRLHFLSESIYLEEETQEELDACLAVLARLSPGTRQALIEALETFKIDQLEIADDHLEADYKKDILVLDLTQSVPLLLDLFAQLADAVEAGQGATGGAPVTEPEPVSEPAPAPVSVTTVSVSVPESVPGSAPAALVPPPTETPSFDLTKRCRHCGTVIPWGEFECPSCHKYF